MNKYKRERGTDEQLIPGIELCVGRVWGQQIEEMFPIHQQVVPVLRRPWHYNEVPITVIQPPDGFRAYDSDPVSKIKGEPQTSFNHFQSHEISARCNSSVHVATVQDEAVTLSSF